MNLLRIYRSIHGDKYSFALPTLDRLYVTKNNRDFYGVLVHAKDGYFEKLDTSTISKYNLIIAIKDSFKDNTLELVPLKGK